MFTGIIQKLAQVRHVTRSNESSQIVLATGYTDLGLGESIAVNGVCLTVIEATRSGDASFFVSAETLNRSNLSRLAEGSWVNLERAMLITDRYSGHIVQGHVDGVGNLLDIHERAGGVEARFTLQSRLARYCLEKGSISLNGVSLTINSVTAPEPDAPAILSVMLIPHTWNHTNLSRLNPGETVNVEVDIIAKYVERLCQAYPRA